MNLENQLYEGHDWHKKSRTVSFKDIYECLNVSQIEDFLLYGTQVTPLIWFANKKNWVKLFLNKNTFHWYSNQDGRLELWIQEVPENIKVQFGLDKNIPDDFVKRYIFSHENNHHVLFYMFKNQNKFPHFANIYNNLKKIRESTWKWLSQLGNMSIYNSNQRQTAHEEDFVELLNKYCMDPKEFKQYLSFLVHWNKTQLSEKHLFRIPQELADWLYNTISECVAIFLKENWITDKIKTK